jgi:predicted RNA-binding protein YlxR (DUF448 family)
VSKRKIKRKHVPQRTCVGCRQVLAKRSLIRIVRQPDGIQIDAGGKLAGRGAYLHESKTCWESGLNGALAHALKIELSEVDIQTLAAYMDTLPTEDSEQQEKDRV